MISEKPITALSGVRIGEAALVLRQLFFLVLQRRDVDADGDDAAIGGAALDHMQPFAGDQFDHAHVRARRIVLFTPDAGGRGRRYRLVRCAHAQNLGAEVEGLGEALVPEQQTPARIPQRERAGEVIDRRAQLLLKPRHARFRFVALGRIDHRAEHARLAAAAGVLDGGAACFDPGEAAAARHAEARIE